MCGWLSNLHVHHVNGDPANNDPENLMTLCRVCPWTANRPSAERPPERLTTGRLHQRLHQIWYKRAYRGQTLTSALGKGARTTGVNALP